MKPRDNTFRISAMNSLRVHEVSIQDQKQLNNTFKGGNDLRSQLTKQKQSQINKYSQSMQGKQNNSSTRINEMNSTIIRKEKPQSQALMDEVAALDNFKVGVTREKTKNLIQKIKLRRRQQHIEAYNRFKQDLQDYKQNLMQIYESLYNDCQQVLAINEQQLSGYFNSQSDTYLLTREKQLLMKFQQQLHSYKQKSNQRLSSTRVELERIRYSRGSVVDETCESLRLKLIEIAFVLGNEAEQIEAKEKEEISLLQEKFYNKYKGMIEEMQTIEQEKITNLQQKKNEVQRRWRQIKQNYQTESFCQSISSQEYINSATRQQLHKRLLTLQQENHKKKKQFLQSLIINQHVDSLRKVNIERWNQMLRSVNDEFDRRLDQLVKQMMAECEDSRHKHEALVRHLQERLKYIGNHNGEEIKSMLQTKFKPMVEKNNETAQQLMKKAIAYVQLNDQKENTLLQNISKFLSSISQTKDDFVKEFATLAQRHQLSHAKVLDDDEELVDKLNAELQKFKKQLKESLHHLRLEEVEKQCFQKIDQIQNAYRKTHQNNKQLVAAMPTILSKFMQDFEAKMAFIFQLYSQSKRAQLAQRNKQDAEKQTMKKIQDDDQKKLQEEQKQLQLIKTNGGKLPPPAKPKDPKKLAAEIEERKKVILSQMGERKIQVIKTGSGNTWLVYKTLEDISKELYKPSLQTPQQGNPPNPDNNQPPTSPLPIDKLPQPITNPLGQQITTSSALLTIPQVSSYLLTLRQKIFQNIMIKKQRILSQSMKQDEGLMEQSLTMLDDRLKRHYSLKGELEAQIFVKRSGEITNHKKRYEKYARTIREKMDLQTERVNFLLEKALEQLKTHNTAQKQLKQSLPQAKNLSQLQGILTKARENFNKFTTQLNQIISELNNLSKIQIQILLQKNKDFIKQSRPLKDGGQYSQEEIKWYEQMMNEITTQIKTQQTKRQEKTKEIQQQSDKRKKQLLQKIEKDYYQQIEELSAKQGTGKVYGKPKRTAQQKIRLEMNKCQQAQLKINQQLQQFTQVYHKERSHSFRSQTKPQTLKWRRQLMTLFTCIQKYAKHIEALKKDLKIKLMPRVNYDQSLSQCTVVSVEDDKKLIEQELRILGPLGQQKQEKPFSKFVLDIEKIISDESRTIYTGDKAKYLTGADKLPDFLRKYIAQMKQSAEDFRQLSIRELRESCLRLGEFCQQIGEMFFKQIEEWFCRQGDNSYKKVIQHFSEIAIKHEGQRTQNLRLLRPNLANPKCQDQLKQLNQKQLTRQTQFINLLASIRQQFKSSHFTNGQKFISSLINNYELLIQYTDSIYLFEDFIKVIGDDQEENKPKLNIKKLMVMKQKGLNIDSSSQRNLVKKWQGVDFTLVNFDDRKFLYKKIEIEEQAVKDNKKVAKKETKKPTNQPPQQAQGQSISRSREIETFKTWRQKSIFDQRQKCLQIFSTKYTTIIGEMNGRLEQATRDSEMFGKKWTKIADELVLK